MARYDDDFETVIGSDGHPVRILRDGGRVRVPLQMRDNDTVPDRPLTTDEMHRSMLDHRRAALVTDGTQDPWALSRPGFRYPTNRSLYDQQRQKVLDAYRDVEEENANAWRSPASSEAWRRS
jgi:hypothetical protein